MNGDVLRERENKAAANPAAYNNNQADLAGGTAVKVSREGAEYQR